MCFQTDKSFASNKEFMGRLDFKLFAKVIDEAVAGGTKAVILSSRGGSTLHPQLVGMLE